MDRLACVCESTIIYNCNNVIIVIILYTVLQEEALETDCKDILASWDLGRGGGGGEGGNEDGLGACIGDGPPSLAGSCRDLGGAIIEC